MLIKNFSVYFLCFLAFVPVKPYYLKYSSKKCKLNTKCVPYESCAPFINLNQDYKMTFLSEMKNICGFVDANRKIPKICCAATKPHLTVLKHRNLGKLPSSQICGPTRPLTSRITQGVIAKPREFPWMVLIAYSAPSADLDPQFEEFKCAGSLISDKYVLTAAHCVENAASIEGVRLGEFDIELEYDQTEDGKYDMVQDLAIKEVKVHPDYNMYSLINDIALIKLATNANFTYGNIKPVCLPTTEIFNGSLEQKFLTVTGWGVTETGEKSMILRKASVRVKPIMSCKRLYGKLKPISNKQICAGGDDGQDSCSADSGGPLQFIFRDLGGSFPQMVQMGIVSYGPSQCGRIGRPAIYTNVQAHINWILDNID